MSRIDRIASRVAAGAEEGIYEQLMAAGVALDHHASDLYAEKTPVSDRIVRGYEHRANVRTFRSRTDGKVWYDIPFAYAPHWERRQRMGKARPPLVADPAQNRRLWSEIEDVAQEIAWMEDEAGSRRSAVATMKAKNLARRYGGTGDDMAVLATSIEEMIWEEYHAEGD